MKPHNPLDRRTFVKLSALAATAAVLPAAAGAAEAYKLDPLPYAFDALAPHIDAKTMEIHHGKHHAAYIKNLNDALAKDAKLAEKSLADLVADLPSISDEAARTTIRNNGGGHWNHDFFWKILTPADKSGKPSGDLAKAIDEAFGSYDEFKNAFGAAAAKRFGSGWAWLISQNGKLKIVSTANQDNPLMKGIVPDSDLGTPIIGLDVWEHAYYLNYQNKRPDYVAAWWNVVNWEEAGKRFGAK
ncbi:superoxide dismutase [Luteolibacter sp. SL250]|uniref:superoxide dismutase n=1 Tax=Luteolibacter sp. SL250 TaxID=2995170 RepID=UPI00226DDBB7|nr:superoxide dismutase [Luteolibacter sp. SL250]WAC20866.1 superoxide dismutase [Luteolibacter sp. SL250]